MSMSWLSGVYAVVLVNVHELVVRCVCCCTGECPSVGLSGVYAVVLAAEEQGRQYVHQLVVRCICCGAGECP